jgi:hypothetical protein
MMVDWAIGLIRVHSIGCACMHAMRHHRKCLLNGVRFKRGALCDESFC